MLFVNPSGRGRLGLQRGRELVQKPTRALLAARRVVVAVEKDALLGEDQASALACRLELDRGQRDRNPVVAEVHVVGVDDAFVRHDVLVPAFEGMDRSAFRTAAVALAPAHPKVEFAFAALPFVWTRKPARLGRRIGKSLENLRRRSVEYAFDDKRGVMGGPSA